MAVNLSPVGGAAAQFFDNNGVPLTGGKLYTYAAGTTSPAPTYTSSAGSTAHTNPIVLDSAGRIPGGETWLNASTQYKFVLKNANDVLIATWDNISGIADGAYTPQSFTGTGSQVIFTLSQSPISEDATFVYINGVYQNKNTYSIFGTALTFSEAPPITSKIEVMFN